MARQDSTDDNGIDDPTTHDVGDDNGVDDPATHDVGDDNGVDDPATHDVGDDNGVDDPATHDVGDDNGVDGPFTWLAGTSGIDRLVGSASADQLAGYAGDDVLDGGAGIDLARYTGQRAEATLHKSSAGWSVASSLDGTDMLVNVERLKFSDISVALDMGANQSAGQAALLLGAALPGQMVFDPSKQLLLGEVIDLFDAGYSLQDLSGALLRLPVWDALTGQAAPTHLDIANYLLTNVNGVAPDQAMLDTAVNALSTESSQGEWLAGLASSAANQLHVGLVGLMDTGLEFVPPQG